MYRAGQPRSVFLRHLAVPSAVGGSASHISALVRMRETYLSTRFWEALRLLSRNMQHYSSLAFACRYSSGRAWLNQTRAPQLHTVSAAG